MNIEQKITSMEVAEMVGKEHKELLRDIRKYCEQMEESNKNSNERKIALVDFFTESTYTDKKGEIRPCYQVTKKGCEFIAHKLTGTKGTEFTAKYINRFHDMEDSINNSNRSLVEQGINIVKFVADDLHVNTASRILMYENYCKDFGIPTGFLPKYELNGNRQMKSLTALLEENGYSIKAVAFNKKLLEKGFLEERGRKSSNGGTKKFKALTEKGLQYGENALNPHNQKEVQPLYYEDSFNELYQLVI